MNWKAANERLRELDRLKDDFMASVSHELRTPLTSIRAFRKSCVTTPKPRCRTASVSSIIVSETERLTRLVNQILDMARSNPGTPSGWSRRSISAASSSSRRPRRASCSVTKNVALELDLAGGLPLLRGDRDRLMQVVINLLSNAVKFAPRRCKVHVRLFRRAGRITRLGERQRAGHPARGSGGDLRPLPPGGDSMTSKPGGHRAGLAYQPQNSRIFQWSPVGRERTRAGGELYILLPLQNNEGEDNA